LELRGQQSEPALAVARHRPPYRQGVSVRLRATQGQGVLEPFGITTFYTDGWGTYERHVEPEKHTVGKAHTQKIESKHINLRTRIKRLVRRTICFSKTERMHDLVIGLFINRYEFGLPL
jgi:insertion element IS1 protein InsB